jgi:mannose-6-phosphate isomerase class I
VKKKKQPVTPLRATLSYTPVEVSFGTSGLRGLVTDLTNLECYATVSGFLAWLRRERGSAAPAAGSAVYLAGDLRPSTASLVPGTPLRGEILQAAVQAVTDAGLSPVYLGAIPTPALALFARARTAPSVMVTGSHIPFERNGIKLATPTGEVLKADEPAILAAVKAAREREYERPAEESLFDATGMFRAEKRPALPEVTPGAEQEYEARYASAFPAGFLAGRRIMVWEHSAVGRDLLARVLAGLGADVVKAGRTDGFVAVDTEAVDDEMVRLIQGLVDARGGPGLDAVVSTDGDGDRPLLLAVDNGRVRFVPGDALGVLAAELLGARHAALPVNANDGVLAYGRAHGMEMVSTRIGSPYVVAALREAGWESNGGFLTAAPLPVPRGGTVAPLPTRDALLPILAVLCSSLGSGTSVSALVDSLPRRYGASIVVRDFSTERAREIMTWLSPADPAVRGARFSSGTVLVRRGDDGAPEAPVTGPEAEEVAGLRARISHSFGTGDGYADVEWVDWRDGVRVGFEGGDIVHLRPSGNAPEMRVYVVTGSVERTAVIVAGARAAGGMVRRLETEAAERAALAGFRALPRAVPLAGAVQHYEWGGHELIPSLIGVENPDSRPFAELWMGTHPRAPAMADIDGARISLERLIAADPWAVLGSDAALRFAGRLPYLFKVLDIRQMLSLQVHPSKAQAEEGFARENAAGIPIDAPNRTYRDDNHKPEVQVALRESWLLHGFRPLEEIAEVLSTEPELAAALTGFDEKRRAAKEPEARAALLRETYARVMTMPQAEVNAMLDPLVARLEAEESAGRLTREHPGFWALRAARTYARPDGSRDRGIVSIYLMNLVHLLPGQGTFQPAGILHAYLEGANVELMSNSDNVVRGGLTPKHMDVPELLATVEFADGGPRVLEGRATSETSRGYETPVDEFALERIEVSQGVPYAGGREHGADTLIVTEGAAAVVAAGRSLTLARGGIVLVPAGVPYSVAARAPRAVLFKAGVP